MPRQQSLNRPSSVSRLRDDIGTYNGNLVNGRRNGFGKNVLRMHFFKIVTIGEWKDNEISGYFHILKYMEPFSPDDEPVEEKSGMYDEDGNEHGEYYDYVENKRVIRAVFEHGRQLSLHVTFSNRDILIYNYEEIETIYKSEDGEWELTISNVGVRIKSPDDVSYDEYRDKIRLMLARINLYFRINSFVDLKHNIGNLELYLCLKHTPAFEQSQVLNDFVITTIERVPKLGDFSFTDDTYENYFGIPRRIVEMLTETINYNYVHNPLIGNDGQLYSNETFDTIFSTTGVSPFTRGPLTSSTRVPVLEQLRDYAIETSTEKLVKEKETEFLKEEYIKLTREFTEKYAAKERELNAYKSAADELSSSIARHRASRTPRTPRATISKSKTRRRREMYM